ncbi:MAG: galactose-1-phosphate uridylyltransferase [Armatimonadetes bacterium]|nr:galactose-1-phosphate uridylyltransferase [Armatimonadota bacterium]
MSELRWHPILGEWVITATHRQNRTFLPPDDFCPLCPTKSGAFPTEVPREDYDIVVFENRFPSLQHPAPPPAVDSRGFSPVKPAEGICEVVLYSSRHDSTLAQMPVRQIHKLIRVWQDRFMELGSLEFVDYVYIFENKGKEIGVTLTHPHGQIYAYSFIPPRMRDRRESFQRYYAEKGSCMLCDILSSELEEGTRIVTQTDAFVAYVPFYARYPYEVHVAPRRHDEGLGILTEQTSADLAHILKTVLLKYDGLWGFSLPYIMNLYPQPTDGGDDPGWHFQIEFYPPYRTPQKLKYLAGSESGAGSFINDNLPETMAEQLRNVEVGLL